MRSPVGFWVIGLTLGAAQVWFATVAHDQPSWLTGVLAVFAFLAAGIGYTAAANVSSAAADVRAQTAAPAPPTPPTDSGYLGGQTPEPGTTLPGVPPVPGVTSSDAAGQAPGLGE